MCSYETCDQPARTKGFCGGHYQQHRKGQPLRPLRERAAGTVCSFDGCGAPTKSRGLCTAHYGQSLRGMQLQARRGKFGDKECSFEGCANPVRANGLCGTHNQQQRLGRQLSPIRAMRDTTERDGQGRKECATCSRWLPESSFTRDGKRPDQLSLGCRSCSRDTIQEQRYNLGTDGYRNLLEAQDGRCAVCRNQLDDGPKTHIDHDHGCCPERGRSCGKCVRGLLCNTCNLGIGYFYDNPASLRAAADYLERG